MGHRNTRGVHRTCNAEISRVQFPNAPPLTIFVVVKRKEHTMKREAVKGTGFIVGDPIVVTSGEYKNKFGIVERLGSAGEDVIYIHARLQGVNTPITFRAFQIQKANN